MQVVLSSNFKLLNMKRFLIIMTSILLFNSCELNSDDSVEYYQFTESNYQFIPTIYNDVGKVFKFKNQFNEEVLIEVESYELTKEKGGGIGTFYSLHYYQSLEITLKAINEDMSISNCSYSQIDFSNYNGDYFISRFWNEFKYEFPFEISQLTINNINYNKIITISNNNGLCFSSNYTIDTVYFDFKKGIIGFDDTENNIQFRIVDE